MTGIYYGIAEFVEKDSPGKKFSVDYNKKMKSVMSIGYNPYYFNSRKTFVFSFNIFLKNLKLNKLNYKGSLYIRKISRRLL